MTAASVAVASRSLLSSSSPLVNLPEDPALVEMPRLFDTEWIWQKYIQQFQRPDTDPHQIRIRQFTHNLGRNAIASYEMEWPEDDYIPSQHLAIRLEQDKPAEIFRYPDDSRLPGLREAADPETAITLLNKHVFAVPAKRARVELIRYRPANRAVLRHRAGKVGFYARVMQPDSAAGLLNGHSLITRSEFVAPRLGGYWAEGGVLWLSEIPGRNLRRHISQGRGMDIVAILDGLQSLWALPWDSQSNRPFNLAGSYQRAKGSFRHNLRDYGHSLSYLNHISGLLDQFVQSWQPTGIAHNDFYDDQMLVLPDGRVALVDFEEAGPGDPLLDMGNFLAHLRWASRFGRQSRAEASGRHYQLFRSAVLERFGWSEGDLALREAVCLFRICTNTIRHPQQDWHRRLIDGLSLVEDALDT